ncbi:Uncharacterised protein [Alistipes finegoldii]|nr:Uncharacterised protein [Alistipes finegoldii]
MSISRFCLSSASSRYSITFSAGSKGLRSSNPIDLTAIRTISCSAIPVERRCLRRKYFPASMSARLGTSPTISVPVTRTPRASALRHTSSKATWSGVVAMSVMFIDTCAMPYSSMNQPIAFVAGSVPGCMTGLPAASFTTLPVMGLPSRTGRPFSRTSNAMALARRVEVVLRLKFTAIRKSRAPTVVAPVRATPSSNGRAPKSGAVSLCASFSGNASYSPARQTARLRRSGMKAAAS